MWPAHDWFKNMFYENSVLVYLMLMIKTSSKFKAKIKILSKDQNMNIEIFSGFLLKSLLTSIIFFE